ncbi:peptidase M61, glycyl monoaminopeptidase [cyanobacterium endosymbiont of Rhopalodia gibberula]|uniref:M61 family metallopeptidase n=1 Tax=cyanobacterium endosymbiont of Rhopalodia gibberula TaxID=1763363 RepID=UPI000DC7005D|nr:M61 family metallopeptidase [cyanobacterium endosymbiont of Rhopalodia gibberula]BBA78906.1 peptidase M61, glycyl monoaminopeptidase [cyanobacterium endosymbiont of Rhopalodia gibberula]
MTRATRTDSSDIPKTSPIIAYTVAMPQPSSHIFEVKLQVSQWQESILELGMPVWTPGSYLVREYARHIQYFYASSSQDKTKLLSQKISKNHWIIETGNVNDITIHYQVYANELTVRTNHLDKTHGYFNGAALFYFITGLEKQSITVQIIPPVTQWKVSTTLPKIPGKINLFQANDYDTLVDSPFEIGTHNIYTFEVLKKSHQLVIWGHGNIQPISLIRDVKKIIEIEAKLYRELPYDHYLFILHLSGSCFGGLEHKSSCSLIYPRFGFRAKDKYNRFIQLVAHEFFHLWNAKRIRPKALETFDYERENYTKSLWFLEGTTSYYDMIMPLRAGIYDIDSFFEILSNDITQYLNTPGRKIHSLSESSFDAWIKLYRSDTHSDNVQISYYLKGELVSLLLDLLIRSRHNNQRSLDNVMSQMWQKFGKPEIGFTHQQLQDVIESVAGIQLQNFFTHYLDATEDLPFDDYLEPFGLKLKPILDSETIPFLGIRIKSENSKEVIKFVEAGSPAEIGGIDTNDELLAIDGIRVNPNQLSERLKDYQSGDIISMTVFHQDQLRTLPVTLAEPQPSRYEVTRIDHPSTSQKQNLMDWLGKE